MTTPGPLIELHETDGPWLTTYELAPELCRLDRALYGGTALAAAIVGSEQATGRPARWMTVQFVAQTEVGAVVEQRIEPLARGRNIDQVRVTATVEGRVLYTALGATATERPEWPRGTGPTMPRVPGPEQGTMFPFSQQAGDVGWQLVSEYIEVPTELGPHRMAMWARLRDQPATDAAKLGFLADMVPLAVCRAAGIQGAGVSLDNTLRVGHLVDSEWVLLDIDGHAAADGYGHGSVHLWAPDGTLLGTGSQTSRLLLFDQPRS